MAKWHGADYWRGHLEAWRQSGHTQAAYCASQGINTGSFRRWRRKTQTINEAGSPSLTLVPIRLAPPAQPATIHLHSPGGWRIDVHGGDAAWLSTLLTSLP